MSEGCADWSQGFPVVGPGDESPPAGAKGLSFLGSEPAEWISGVYLGGAGDSGTRNGHRIPVFCDCKLQS